jgi:hypothetical protein
VLWSDHAGNLQGDGTTGSPLLGTTSTKGWAWRCRAEAPWPTWATRAAWAWGARAEAARARRSGALIVAHACGPAKRQR